MSTLTDRLAAHGLRAEPRASIDGPDHWVIYSDAPVFRGNEADVAEWLDSPKRITSELLDVAVRCSSGAADDRDARLLIAIAADLEAWPSAGNSAQFSVTKEQELRRQLTIAQEALHQKNLALDAAYYVWCDGGCPGGILRWKEEHHAPPLSEEIVEEAERQVRRLRTWLDSGRTRIERGYSSTPGADKLAGGELAETEIPRPPDPDAPTGARFTLTPSDRAHLSSMLATLVDGWGAAVVRGLLHALDGADIDAVEPECPGPDCRVCAGEFCETHGYDPCECDVIDRHETTPEVMK